MFADTPETRIRLGTSLDPDAIKEDSDVYFDCLIQAEPPVYKVEWRHQVLLRLYSTRPFIILMSRWHTFLAAYTLSPFFFSPLLFYSSMSFSVSAGESAGPDLAPFYRFNYSCSLAACINYCNCDRVGA